MLDIAVLRVIKYREEYNKVAAYIPVAAMDKRTKAIADDIGKYFDQHDAESKLNFHSFRSLFFNKYHKNLNDTAIDYYNKILTQMEADVPPHMTATIINSLIELEFVTKVADRVDSYQAGDDIAIVEEIDDILLKAKHRMISNTSAEFATFDESTEVVSDDVGLKWHLPCLNRVYRNIQGGDQYIIAARPGVGKTTFLTHLLSVLAKQLPENKVIVWFNNESKRQRIMTRQVQSALGMTKSQMGALREAGKLKEEYIKVIGAVDRIRIFDVHNKDTHYLERVLESIGLDNVGAIVGDMLDNVRIRMPDGAREDQRLEHLYQWFRELGVVYDAPTFPTSQISNEGAGLLFPLAGMLKDSKTGKQGACDGIITIGQSDDPMQERTRGISMPKTKSKREGQNDLREEVLLDADRGRYIDETE